MFPPGQVELSPSEVALVCEAGDQLQLTCNSSSPLHTWQFTAISKSGAAMTYETCIQSLGPTGLVNSLLIINSTVMFTFSRLSTKRDLPLITRVIIDNVSEGLNGVEMRCADAGMINSATTTIQIIGGRLLSWTISGSIFYIAEFHSEISAWGNSYRGVAISYTSLWHIQVSLAEVKFLL